MEEIFEKATNLKGKNRQEGTELRKDEDAKEVEGCWKKYKGGWFYVTVETMLSFWASKWETKLFRDLPLKDLFSNDYIGQAGKGGLLYGWSRENFEMIDETWQAHTAEDTQKNFEKPTIEQDPFFGSTPIFKRLMQRANEIR